MADHQVIINRIIKLRSKILGFYPFYGDLLLQLKPALASCGTACTDMERIIFDPDFLYRLSDDEAIFVMLHEVLHCVLAHCSRSKDYEDLHRYNIAADIVVNSLIMEQLDVSSFEVAGISAMHLTPDGREGRDFTAEEVYNMLGQYDFVALGITIDNHDLWKEVDFSKLSHDEWIEKTKKALGAYFSSKGIPKQIRNLIDLDEEGKVNWKEVLREFILEKSINLIYDYSPPDRRYAGYDFALPSLNEMEEEKDSLENLWFCADASGSISDKMLAELINEVRSVFHFIPNTTATLSFFSTMVTDPIPFDRYTSGLKPDSTFGTSFHCIFDYMREKMTNKLPAAVIILTDGYADYPPEKNTLNIPVLWILNNYYCEDPPFGKIVHF